MSKARWGIGVGVVLVLVPVFHEGYYHVLHSHHSHHYHLHHPRRRRPTRVHSPNWVGIERLTTITEDSRDEGCAPRPLKGCEKLDSLPQKGTRPQKRWGREAVPHKRSCLRRPFDQKLGRSSLGPPYPKFLGWCRGTLDWWWSCPTRLGTRYRTLAEDVGHPHRPCLLFEGLFKGIHL